MHVDTAAVLCQKCSWFGVYRKEVTRQFTGCPNCGAGMLVARDLGDERWQELGRELLDDLDAERREPRAGDW